MKITEIDWTRGKQYKDNFGKVWTVSGPCENSLEDENEQRITDYYSLWEISDMEFTEIKEKTRKKSQREKIEVIELSSGTKIFAINRTCDDLCTKIDFNAWLDAEDEEKNKHYIKTDGIVRVYEISDIPDDFELLEITACW